MEIARHRGMDTWMHRGMETTKLQCIMYNVECIINDKIAEDLKI